ncbi:hypothetical protein Jiend_39480 [Micromonospora endophytica]|nr:hypothetical protein Jiend_39480 [Micromonospora endophytica]
MPLRGQPEGQPVGAVRGRVIAGPPQRHAAQPGRLGRAERLGGDRDGLQPGDRLDRPSGGDGQADLAELAHVAGPRAVRAVTQQFGRVGLAVRVVVAEGGPAGGGIAVRGQAAGAQPVGATRCDEPVEVQPDIAQYAQTAVAVTGVVQRHGVAQPDAGCGERLLGDPGGAAELPGALDRPERVPVEAQVRVGHGQVVPAPGGVPVRVVHRVQRAGRLDQVGDAAVQRALVVRGQRGQRVEVSVQVGLGEIAYGRGGLLDGPGVLGRAAQVDQGGEALDERVGAGVWIPGGAQHPLQDRARLDRAAHLLQRPRLRQGVNLVIDPVEPAHPEPPVGVSPAAPAYARAPRRLMIIA